MIKYEKEFKKELMCDCDGDNPSNHTTSNPETIKKFIKKCLLRQIDEDNKRFLGYVGEDEVLNNDPHDVFEDADKIAKNELRQELRDKVNKR